MELRPLGQTDLKVSAICLGTMTWGEQNTLAEAHAQLDFATERGVNFVDTAELYAVPPRAETQGVTERILGEWIAARGGRDRLILATKVVGRSPQFGYIREGRTRLDAPNIERALEDSLKRLQTDYIDLYQLHWPDRPVNNFGRLGYVHDTVPDAVPLEETLQVLDKLVRAGKIRYVGVSNETPWGVMRCVQASMQQRWPRIQSIQNPYSLLNRSFEVGLAEVAHQEQVGLLAYSPLGFGVLSGKYRGGKRPAGARITRWPNYDRYLSPAAQRAVEAYARIAEGAGMSLAQLALAFVNSRPFVTSTIIGATSLAQLEENLAAEQVVLPPALRTAIDEVHGDISNPSP